MNEPTVRWAAPALVAVALALGGAPEAGSAQSPGGFGAPSQARGGPGFLFESPRVSVGVRGGMFFHRAGSDLYEFTEERFTVDRSDFRGVSFGVEGAVWLGTRTEVALGIDGSRLTLRSEARDWMEEDGSPILQATRLTQGPGVSLGVRRYLVDRGERLGQFIWIPAQWNAFVAGGGGISGYRFEQWGDFVDEVEEIIFTDTVETTGTIAFPFLGAGIEFSPTTRTAFTLEGRYQWGQDDLGPNFRRFEPMDLSGARVTAGLFYRF